LTTLSSSLSFLLSLSLSNLSFFFFNDTATPDIYTLSLHDALPIWLAGRQSERHWYECCPEPRLPGFARKREAECTSGRRSLRAARCSPRLSGCRRRLHSCP